MPFNSVKRKESKPGKQETQALVPAPHSLVTRHKPWKLQFPDALNGDKKASQGFLLDEGGNQRSINTCELVFGNRVLKQKQRYGTRTAIYPVPKADVANQCQHFLIKLY